MESDRTEFDFLSDSRDNIGELYVSGLSRYLARDRRTQSLAARKRLAIVRVDNP